MVYCSGLKPCAVFIGYRLYGFAIRTPPSPLLIIYKELIFNLVDFFMSKKLHQKCTDPVSTHFYGRFSNCTYPIFSFHLTARNVGRITSTHSLMSTNEE